MESTAGDLARFAEALRTAKLLSPASTDLAWTPTRLADGTLTEYGLGFRIDAKTGLISHTGSQQGASAALLIDRARERIVVVLINTKNIEASRLAQELRQL
jgi:CubicO group peptidase (beta-lactamase class C family)